MRRTRAILVAATSLILAACSVIVDLDGLGGPADASDSSVTDSAGDAAGDADAALLDAASCDAGFCACHGAAHAVCNDFDEDGGMQGSFDGITAYGGATGALDMSNFFSGPRSAKFQFVTLSDGGTAGYSLYWNTKKPGTSFTAEARVFISSRPTSSALELIDITFANNTEIDWTMSPFGESLVVICHAPCVSSLDSGSFANYTLSSVLPTNKWVDVKFAVTFGATLSYAITYDGVSAGSSNSLPFAFPSATSAFYAGATYESYPTNPFTISFDDVTFDVK